MSELLAGCPTLEHTTLFSKKSIILKSVDKTVSATRKSPARYKVKRCIKRLFTRVYGNLVKQQVETECRNTSQNTKLKKTLFWASEVRFKLFFRYECHTFNFDFFWFKFFRRLLIWPLCIFFAPHYFSNLRSVKSLFFCENFFIGIFFTVIIFFCKTNNITKNPLYTKSKRHNIFKA